MAQCNLIITCPYCGKIFNNKNNKTSLIKHSIYCSKKYAILQYFNNDITFIKSELIRLGSVTEFSKFYKTIISDNFNFYKFFDELNINKKEIAFSSDVVKNKRKQTNLDKYGCEHNFSKNHPSRIKWESRLLEEEGITNVFQRESVKEKITESLLSRYNVTSAAKCENFKANKDFYINKYGEELGLEKYKESCYNKGKSGRLSYYIDKLGEEEGIIEFDKRLDNIKFRKGKNTGLNDNFKLLLDELNIIYEREFKISVYNEIKKSYRRYYYDFKINDTLIEVNGDFWHANPNIYKSHDIVKYPGTTITAKEVWEKDILKKELAELHGYKIIYIWESEFYDDIENIKKILLNLVEIKN